MMRMMMASLMVILLQDIIELDLNNDWEVSAQTILALTMMITMIMMLVRRIFVYMIFVYLYKFNKC